MNRWSSCVPVALAGMLLAACQQTPPRIAPAPPLLVPTPAPTAALPQSAAADNINAYKTLVAGQILAANPDGIFSGRLPPMLPAIVVLGLGVNRDGELTHAEVTRSRDGEASKVALAAVRRVGQPFPRPQHLMQHGQHTLEFSETFLFDEQYRFQLRSLAGPQ